MSRQLIVGFVVAGLAVVRMAPSAAGLDANSPSSPREMTFDLKEISTLNLDYPKDGVMAPMVAYFLAGYVTWCQDKPFAEVFYPRLKSKKPLYGAIRFGTKPGGNDSGIEYVYVIDESEGTGKGYDLLYLDTNRDRDLSNDNPSNRLRDPPKQAIALFASYGTKEQVLFEAIEVPVPLDHNTARPMRFLPRLRGLTNNVANLSLVTLQVHTGKIAIADRSFTVFLGHHHLVTGWFDDPFTMLYLVPDKGSAATWVGSQLLMGMHKIAGTFYRFSCSPAGDRLTVRPVAGPFGTLKAGTGGRKTNASQATLEGSLRSKDACVAIGDLDKNGRSEATASCQLPPGDYLPEHLTIHLGSLDIDVRVIYPSDDEPGDRPSRPFHYGIQIRPDRPFVFELPNRPDVMFASPAKDLMVKRGDDVDVKAVLIADPNLDAMISGLRCGDNDIVPSAVVTRQGGEIVAQGPMPFG